MEAQNRGPLPKSYTAESNVLSPTCVLMMTFSQDFLVESRPGVRVSLEYVVLLIAFCTKLRERSRVHGAFYSELCV